jgi:hypothetical protein
MDERTTQDIVNDGLALARLFYGSMGYEVEKGFKFYESTHPAELHMWDLACIAFEEIDGTDLQDCLSEIDV